MESDCRNLLEKLDEIARTEISSVFNGTGDAGGRICDLCLDINKAIDMFIYPNKNHGIHGGNTRLHLYTKMTNFLKENL